MVNFASWSPAVNSQITLMSLTCAMSGIVGRQGERHEAAGAEGLHDRRWPTTVFPPTRRLRCRPVRLTLIGARMTGMRLKSAARWTRTIRPGSGARCTTRHPGLIARGEGTLGAHPAEAPAAGVAIPGHRRGRPVMSPSTTSGSSSYPRMKPSPHWKGVSPTVAFAVHTASITATFSGRII